MNFFKKNIIFTIVAAITLLGSILLIYLDWTKHDAVTAANELTQKSENEFNAAFQKGNKPVALNIQMIKQDTEVLRAKTTELQRVFGKPYRKALQQFAASFKVPKDDKAPAEGEDGKPVPEEKVTEDDLYRIMRELFENGENTVKTADVLIPKFFAALEKEKRLKHDDVIASYRKFLSDVQLETVEDFLTLEAGYDILGAALGLPRTMSASMAHVYLGQMQHKIRNQRLIPGVTTLGTVQKFTFDQYVESFPSVDAIRDILDTMPVFEDIFRRMTRARLTRVEDFTRENVVKVSDKYTVYNFKTTVIGPMKAVREFSNSLLNAYKDNRVYAITWVLLTSEDSANEVESERKLLFPDSGRNEQLETEPVFGRNPRSRGRVRNNAPRRNAPAFAAGAALRRPPSEMEAEMQPDYGSTVIGISSNVKAEIKFKYYVFTGDILQKQ